MSDPGPGSVPLLLPLPSPSLLPLPHFALRPPWPAPAGCGLRCEGGGAALAGVLPGLGPCMIRGPYAGPRNRAALGLPADVPDWPPDLVRRGTRIGEVGKAVEPPVPRSGLVFRPLRGAGWSPTRNPGGEDEEGWSGGGRPGARRAVRGTSDLGQTASQFRRPETSTLARQSVLPWLPPLARSMAPACTDSGSSWGPIGRVSGQSCGRLGCKGRE